MASFPLGPPPGPKNESKLSAAAYRAFCDLVHRRFGIYLSPGHESFVATRLQPVLRRSGCASPEAFLELLHNDRSGLWESELANAITTQYTGFFREAAHFDFLLTHVLPDIAERKRREDNLDLRVWSAGCATGAEPYSLVMAQMAFFGVEYEAWQAGALATDISDAALVQARLGRYAASQIAGVPPAYRHYFTPGDDNHFVLSETIKREVCFRRFNLMEGRFPFKRPFDIIFCRNVVIYFDTPTRNALMEKFYGMTAPGGYLFLGHSETLDRENSSYVYLRPSVYRRAP